ncbi:MAG: hypothetical protein D6794_10490 [Deltaproteobacteria bacterium]|nr:MAG: hypothetical protein D6794_10490 [Deltaproteobacteria bacterium]
MPGWGYPNWRRDLNLSNRPVRTRMPGGVGGVGGADAPPPLSRSRPQEDPLTTSRRQPKPGGPISRSGGPPRGPRRPIRR